MPDKRWDEEKEKNSFMMKHSGDVRSRAPHLLDDLSQKECAYILDMDRPIKDREQKIVWILDGIMEFFESLDTDDPQKMHKNLKKYTNDPNVIGVALLLKEFAGISNNSN